MNNKIDQEDLLNGWLKYHNTNTEEVAKKHPKLIKTADWFKKYPVTNKQHDDWVKWAKNYIKKKTGYSKKMIDKGWFLIYLNCAPNVK